MSRFTSLIIFSLLGSGFAGAESYDLILRGGTVYDGSGDAPRVADVAVQGDRVAAIGDLAGDTAATVIDVTGLAVAPGFINMLSWAAHSLLDDGRGLSDIAQGVTLEVFGEGWTLGPVNEDRLKTDSGYRIGVGPREGNWTTLGEALSYLETKGVSPNVASFVGATSVRTHQLGYADRAPSASELVEMQRLVREAMEEGALGVGSSLIYPPASFSSTEELIALATAAAEYDGMYISHIRNEGPRLREAIGELIAIAKKAGIRAEVYHLKALGQTNWDSLDQAIADIERARDAGVSVAANIYTYSASGTGLTVCIPDWVQEGGHGAMMRRLRDADTRATILTEMRAAGDGIHNPYRSISVPDKILLVGFKNPDLHSLIGRTLTDVADARGKPPEEVAMDLIVEDESRVDAIYFMMSEENIRKKIALPWVSFGSDAPALAPQDASGMRRGHPRAFGNFARLLGKYVRDENVIPLEEAVRKLTSLPAERLRIRDRGRLAEGYFADIAVFDPAKVRDTATYENPQQLAEGMMHVLVNGEQVLRDGKHTGATPGRFVRGPGWTGRAN
jgi:N-acyl-D-amino-acid deacylase